jgi:alpha-L-fucosidase
MKRLLILTLFLSLLGLSATAQDIMPIPSENPNNYQKQQIKRQYGMFIHFGINTFCDEEWTDGSVAPKKYAPPVINARQWVETAKKAGMKYIILVTKHVEGFCLWDSKVTNYDVASSGNTTNVVEAVAKECKRQGIRLGLYYSLWDRKQNPDVENKTLDAAYNEYMIRQLNELMDITDRYTPIVEFWFDSTWMKPSYRWPLQEIYNTVKKREPQCQITFNWTIGKPDNENAPSAKLQGLQVPPEKQKEGDEIRYFPSDFRIGDPYLPSSNDPKHFTHDGKRYYMPWETTLCLRNKWFYNTTDSTLKSIDELKDIYRRATAQDNILIVDVPPTREGVMREGDRQILFELRKQMKIK